MAITRKDLQYEVDRLNKKYCKNTKHKLSVQGAYGGYQVQLTGKRRKDGKGYRGYLRSGVSSMTYGFRSAKDTLFDLYANDSQGYLKRRINEFEKLKRRR